MMKKGFYSVFLGFCLLVAAGHSAGFAQEKNPPNAPITIGEIIIHIHDGFANGTDWTGIARTLIGLKIGDPLTAERLEQAEKNLAPLAVSKSTVEMMNQTAIVTFEVIPYKRIKHIRIHGNYPLFESDVLKVMTLSIGDFFRAKLLEAQADLIARRFQAEGYIDPQVKVTWRQDPDDGHYDVNVTIDKGPAYVLSKVKITGNRNVADVVLMGLMRTWRRPEVWIGTGRFVAADFKVDIDRLLTHYRGLGYADAQIDFEVTKDPQNRQVLAKLTIQEGPLYTVAFSGNHFYSESALRKELDIFRKGNNGNVGLRRSIQNIRRRYLEAGFADVRVRRAEPSPDQTVSGQVAVDIEIEEGPRRIVEQVVIEGNRQVGTEEIQGQMLTRPPSGLGKGAYVASVLQEDIAALRALYQKYGFLDPELVESIHINDQTKNVVVRIQIHEGIQTRVGRLTVQGQSPVSEAKLLRATQLKSGQPFQPYKIADDENALAAVIAPAGYPHVLVQAKVTFAPDKSLADIVYHVDAGPYTQMGQIFWSGNFRTRSSVLKQQIKLEPGRPFSLAEVLEAQRQLRDLELFQSVQVRTIGLKEKARQVHLLFSMVEKPPYYFELGGGYETSKGVYGRTKVGDKNFMGTGKALRLSGEQSQVGYHWEVGATDPRMLGSDIRADLGLYIENEEAFNQDFGYDTLGGKLTFSRPWGQQVKTALALSYERRQQYLREKDAATVNVDPETLEPRAIVVASPSLHWDTRDSFIQPRRGGLTAVSVDISKGLESAVDNFVKYKLDVRGYHSPSQRLILAGRLFSGYIQPYGMDGEIPKDQLFYLGGTNDVRGFAENMLRYNADEDPVGGKLALAVSVEARYVITGNWELTLFTDGGCVQQADTQENRQSNTDDWQYTAGLGLRYMTPIGPIGLLYGHKLNPRPGEDSGAFHFSIGYTF